MSQKKFLHTLLERVVNNKGFDQYMKNENNCSHLPENGDGKCKAQFTVAEEHLNAFGIMHGGLISTIIDVISSYALMTYKPDLSPSVDLHVTFLKAARLGEVLTVNAETIRAGKTLAFLAVEITKNDGKDVIARGQHTKYIPPIKK